MEAKSCCWCCCCWCWVASLVCDEDCDCSKTIAIQVNLLNEHLEWFWMRIFDLQFGLAFVIVVAVFCRFRKFSLKFSVALCVLIKWHFLAFEPCTICLFMMSLYSPISCIPHLDYGLLVFIVSLRSLGPPVPTSVRYVWSKPLRCIVSPDFCHNNRGPGSHMIFLFVKNDLCCHIAKWNRYILSESLSMVVLSKLDIQVLN